MWEIYALAVVSELRTRTAMAKLGEFELDVLYAQAKAKMWAKIQQLREHPGIRFAEFGTRRRHSFLWQEWGTTAFADELPTSFLRTSNAVLGFKHAVEAIGTHSHELPLVLAHLAKFHHE